MRSVSAAIGAQEASPMMASRPRIAVVAINSGNSNRGDEAVLSGALHALRSRIPDPEIVVYSVNPTDTARLHGVDAVSVFARATAGQAAGQQDAQTGRASERWRGLVRTIPVVARAVRMGVRLLRRMRWVARQPGFIVRTWFHMRRTDLLLVAGSNQLEDSISGPWSYPYTILLCTVLARLAGARVAFVAVGAGPLDARLSRWMCLRALRMTTYASFRDQGSLDFMQGLGYRGPATVVPDLAYALDVTAAGVRPKGVQPRVAVNLFPFGDPLYDPSVTDGGTRFAAYVDAVAEFVIDVQARGLQPVLFGTQRGDRRTMDLVRDRIRDRAPDLGEIEHHLPTSYDDLIAIIDESDVVVGTRYHGILFGLLRGRPTIGICYQAKSRRLLEMAGLGQYAVEADGLSATVLLDQLGQAMAMGGASERIRARAMEMHVECRKGFDDALDRCLPGFAMRTHGE